MCSQEGVAIGIVHNTDSMHVAIDKAIPDKRL